MLRFHKFTIGWCLDRRLRRARTTRSSIAGCRAYSPLHNVRHGERYPATLVLTGDHDDRVVPGHSFKFAARCRPPRAATRPC